MAAAVAVVSMAGGALGDHHPGEMNWPNCDFYPWDCQGHCQDLLSCLYEGEEIDCIQERALLESCAAPPIIIIPPPSNYECGDDEIGGGSEECEKCGPGEVPNEDGTACEECEHGEFKAGECASLCSNAELDSAAAVSLGGIPREPWERLEAYTCDSAGHMNINGLALPSSAAMPARSEKQTPPPRLPPTGTPIRTSLGTATGA